MSAKPLLQVRGVGKVFGTLRALDDVSVDVFANTFHGLIGPNGSGKSTLLKAIAGRPFRRCGHGHLQRHRSHPPAASRAVANGVEPEIPDLRDPAGTDGL